MLQTIEIRRAVEESRRAIGAFQVSPALIRHPSPKYVLTERRSNSIAALTQAADLHAQTVSEPPTWEDFRHPTGTPTQSFSEPGDHQSLVLAAGDPVKWIIHRRATTPTTPETQIAGIIGHGGTVTTFYAGFRPSENPIRRDEQVESLPRAYESGTPHDESPQSLDTFPEAGLPQTTVAHSIPHQVFISHVRSGARNPLIRAPHPGVDTYNPAVLLGYSAGTRQETELEYLREYATGTSAAQSNPVPVDVFPHIPQHLEDLFCKIERLPENWNSYGAAQISQWAIAEARKIVNDGMGLGLGVPAISPASGASVGIEWQTDNTDLVIDVDPQEGITYLIVDRNSGAEIEGELNADNRFEVLRKVTGL